MPGRLHRNARFIAATTYGSRSDADAAITRVRQIHGSIGGNLLDGRPYRANDPMLLAWVHAAEATSFFDAWKRFGNARVSPADEDAYFSEFALVAESSEPHRCHVAAAKPMSSWQPFDLS